MKWQRNANDQIEGEIVKKRIVCFGTAFLLGMALLTGCEKGPSREEVEGSKYYQKLQTANKEQKKKIESLEEEMNALQQALVKEQQKEENQTSAQHGNKKAEKYLEKIENSSLISVEVGYTDEYCDPVYVRDSAIFALAKRLGTTADLTTKYTPEELREEMGSGYVYTLYEEDNSIFQAEIYGDGYVIFRDLPGQVYYCKGSNSLGQAYLVRRTSYPNSKLLHRMADSAIVVKSNTKAWTQKTALKAANYIDSVEKKKIKESQKKEAKKTEEYNFFSYGNRMELSLYESQICITAWDGTEVWFQFTDEQVKELKNVIEG